MRNVFFILFLMGLLTATGCKKDQLRANNITEVNSNTSVRLNHILFVDDSLGFIAGGERFDNATILKTTDGGLTWTATSYPDAGKGMYGMTLAPGGKIYACGFDGKLLHSSDRGQHWQFSQLNYLAFKKIAFPTPNHGVVIGGISFYAGCLQHIDSAGSYQPFDSLGYELNDIVLTGNTGYIAGTGVVLKTTDAGVHWQLLPIANDNFKTICIGNDSNMLWVGGYNGSIYHSSDAGASWQCYRNGNDITLPRYRLLHMVFTDAQHGWAVGEDGLLIHTDDGGRHWMEYEHFTDAALFHIAICPNGDLLACGEQGKIFRIRPTY